MKTVLALIALLAGGAVMAADAVRPNIIVIYTDDHGYADLGCQDVFKDVKTPNIDLLAGSGVRMTAGYVTAPQCGPSRSGLISGQYQNRFGMEANGDFEKDASVLQRFRALKTLPQRLKDAGYVTGMAGKSHLGSSDSAELVKLGFDKAFSKHSDAPGRVKPGKSEALVSQVDFLASFAALTGEKIPTGHAPDSEDHLAALLGTDPTGRKLLVEQKTGDLLGFRQGNWKLLPTGGKKAGNKATLYHLAHDLSETKDLAAEQPERVAAMMKQLETIVGKLPTGGKPAKGGDSNEE